MLFDVEVVTSPTAISVEVDAPCRSQYDAPIAGASARRRRRSAT